MTQEQKLKELIQKAIDNGCFWLSSDEELLDTGGYTPPWGTLVFSHDFAKALFGEDVEYAYRRTLAGKVEAGKFILWQDHLQQAVISDNPIGYMYEAVFGGQS